MERINKLNKTVETLNTERKQLLDTNASQQQTIEKLTTVVSDLQKPTCVSDSVVKPTQVLVEEPIKPPTPLTEEELKADNDMLKTIAKRLNYMDAYDKSWGKLIYVQFTCISYQQIEYLKALLGINKTCTKEISLVLEDLDTYHYANASEFYLSSDTFANKFSKLIPFVSDKMTNKCQNILEEINDCKIKLEIKKIGYSINFNQYEPDIKFVQVLTREQACTILELFKGDNIVHVVENEQSVFKNITNAAASLFLKYINE
jgi:hypothetical protein